MTPTARCTVCLEQVELTGEPPLTRFSTHADRMFNETCSGSGDPHWTTPTKLDDVTNRVASLNPVELVLLLVGIAVAAGYALWWVIS